MFTLNRRMFLRGAGAAVVGLPLLESLVPRGAAAQAAAPFRYALFLRQGNGVQQGIGSDEPDRFWPTKLGALTTAGMKADGDRAVNVLADYAQKLLVVRGVEMVGAVDAGCGHAQGGLLCLTASRADGTNKERALALGESIDNRIERALSGEGKEPLTLRAGPSSTYLNDVLSYRGARDRRVAQSTPYEAYRAVFGLTPTEGDGGAQALRKKSINDLIRNEMSALLGHPRLSAGDKNRLEQHRAAIRDTETALTCTLPSDLVAALSATDKNRAESDDAVQPTLALHARVMALAVACGRQRAATLQVGNGNDQTQYTINGNKYERFHHISHRINSDGATGDAIANADVKHHEIDKMFAGLFRTLVKTLDDYETVTGTLLDDGVAIWLNDLANGPPHSIQNMPYVCAGGCGGRLVTGQYVDASPGSGRYTSHNQFLNTIAAAVGVKNGSGAPLDDFGDASLTKGRIAKMIKSDA
jgi:Protein of unknown function (DUF1552)